MKKLVPFLVLSLSIHVIQAQDYDFCIFFDDAQYLDRVTIDSVTYPENCWQIGSPQKPGFNYAHSQPNAIITDTINSYPVNNVSVFTIMDFVLGGYYYGLKIFSGYYYIQSDSLNDYGKMEFSPDNGSTWIDLINDTLYPANFQWDSNKPVLTGNSNDWKYFEIMLVDIGSIFNIQIGDTLLFRFTFTSDDTQDNLGGLMYDDICFWEFIEGISETRFMPIRTSIFPNPSKDFFTINFENPRSDFFELAVYDEQSHRVITKENIGGKSFFLNAASLKPGIYFYKLTNNNLKERGWGKMVVE